MVGGDRVVTPDWCIVCRKLICSTADENRSVEKGGGRRSSSILLDVVVMVKICCLAFDLAQKSRAGQINSNSINEF